MARALEPVAQSEILRRHPSLTFQDGGFQWRIVRDGDRSVMTVTGKGETVTAPLLWAFGRGQAGQTYIFERDGIFYESRVSFYNALGRPGPHHGRAAEPGRRISTTRPAAAWTTSTRAIASAATRPARSPAAACTWNRSSPAWAANPATGPPTNTWRRCAPETLRRRRWPKLAGRDRRRDRRTLRALPPHVVADRAEWPSRRAQRPLPTVPPDQQQVLRHRRRAHRLHRLPRSARSARDRRGKLRCQMLRLPFRGAAHQNLPGRQSQLRDLPHAEDRTARRARPLHGSPDSHRSRRRSLPELT